jgi:hypothetical protein
MQEERHTASSGSDGWRPRSGVNGSGRRLCGMLRGGGDSLVDHLLWHGLVEELAA